eukprot:sb/3474940/
MTTVHAPRRNLTPLDSVFVVTYIQNGDISAVTAGDVRTVDEGQIYTGFDYPYYVKRTSVDIFKQLADVDLKGDPNKKTEKEKQKEQQDDFEKDSPYDSDKKDRKVPGHLGEGMVVVEVDVESTVAPYSLDN